MPHCDLELYENIIGANWSEENLRRIIFIANRFSDYVDKYASPFFQSEKFDLLMQNPTRVATPGRS